MATEKISGNRLSYYQYGDDVVYNLAKNPAGEVTSWNYYPAGNLGLAIGGTGGIDPKEFEYLPNGPGSANLQTTQTDSEPLDIASWNRQEAATKQVNNAAEQVQQAQEARVENANTQTPEPISLPDTQRLPTNTNAFKGTLDNTLYKEDGTNNENSDNPTIDTNDLDNLATDSLARLTPDTNDLDNLATDSLASLTKTNKEDNVNSERGGGNGSGAVSTNNVEDTIVSVVPPQYYAPIKAKENPLKEFASYTYSISVYLVNKAGLQRLQNGVKSVDGLHLILQSGGASTTSMYGAKRSPFFKNDYYIDNVELDGIVSGTSTQSVHNQHTIRFTITEPFGITFLENLHKAVTEYRTSLGQAAANINYASQVYLMVIRFYGQDKYGNVTDLSKLTNQKTEFSEKYIPFIFTGVRFRLENNQVEYQCEASAPMSFYNLNTTHTAIPFNLELHGGKIRDVLTASQVSSQVTTERTQANTTQTTTTLYTGLEQALNDHQKKLVKDNLQTYANVYRFKFEDGIETNDIDLKGQDVNKGRSAMASSKSNPQSPATDRVNKNETTITIQAGTSIVQLIEQVVRQSTFITNQQNVIFNENTGLPEAKPGSNEPFRWFKVIMQATPISDAIDPITNDYAYELVFKIKSYQVGNANSPYYPPPIFRGVHKEYPYWFTGENTEILNFQQDFNYLYYQQYGPGSTVKQNTSINTVHVTRNYYMPRAAESTQGTENRAGEPSASVASQLYSPGDLAVSSVEIMGDPDWIAQSEIFYGVDRVTNDPFEEDGSVNYNASEIYYSISWNLPGDYNLRTGLADIVRDSQDPKQPNLSLAYRANRVVSKFSKGAFTQQLEGTLMQWIDDPQVTRVDQYYKFQPVADTKRVDSQTTAKAKSNLNPDDVAFRQTGDAALEYGTLVGSQQSRMLAEFDEGFTYDDTNEDTAATDTVKSAAAEAQLDAIEQEEWRQRELAGLPFVADELDTGSAASGRIVRNSTEPPLTPNSAPTNPSTMTQNSITKTGQDKTIEQTPTFQQFPIPQPEPVEQTFPSFRDVNPNTLTEGQVIIVTGSGGELLQVRKEADGTLSGIAEQDPDTGEWYTI